MTDQNAKPRVDSNYDLAQRWPDLVLNRSFQDLLEIYRTLAQKKVLTTSPQREALRDAYKAICGFAVKSATRTPVRRVNGADTQMHAARVAAISLMLTLKTYSAPQKLDRWWRW